jgi:hypothetical protein
MKNCAKHLFQSILNFKRSRIESLEHFCPNTWKCNIPVANTLRDCANKLEEIRKIGGPDNHT